MKIKNKILVIDFDSTFVTVESLDELANIVLRERKDRKKVLHKIKEITKLGMEGKIPFPESLSRRLSLFQFNKMHVQQLIVLLQKSITPSIQKNNDFFNKNAKNIYIISGGFKEYILPIVLPYGILENHVLANTIVFDTKDTMIDFSRENPLAQEKGKINVVKTMHFKKPVIVIGDGYTDYEIKQAGLAQKFIAFTENITREIVSNNADFVAQTFEEIIKVL